MQPTKGPPAGLTNVAIQVRLLLLLPGGQVYLLQQQQKQKQQKQKTAIRSICSRRGPAARRLHGICRAGRGVDGSPAAKALPGPPARLALPAQRPALPAALCPQPALARHVQGAWQPQLLQNEGDPPAAGGASCVEVEARMVGAAPPYGRWQLQRCQTNERGRLRWQGEDGPKSLTGELSRLLARGPKRSCLRAHRKKAS